MIKLKKGDESINTGLKSQAIKVQTKLNPYRGGVIRTYRRTY